LKSYTGASILNSVSSTENLAMRQAQKISNRSVNVPLTVAVLSLSGLLVVSQLYLAIPLFPILSQFFDISPGFASWLSSSFGFAYALGFLIFGPLSDRYSCKVVLVPGLTVLALATFAIGGSSSFETLVQLRGLQGFIAASFAPAALAYVSEVLPKQSRGLGIACVTTGFLLAGILGQVYSSFVSLTYGWRWVFWFLAFAYAVAALTVAKQLPDSIRHKPNVNIPSVYRNMATLLKSHSLLAAYAATLMVLLSFVAMYSGLEPYLSSHYKLDQNDLLLIRMAGIPGMLLSPMFGYFIQWWGSKKVVVSGLVLAAIGLGLEVVSLQLPLLVFASGIFVAGISATVPALIALVSSIGVKARGAAVALYTFVLFVGASFGSLITTSTSPVGFVGLCIILIFFLLAAAVTVQMSVENID
jgi:MFS transporter, YNFM family, putative membrane transport protein